MSRYFSKIEAQQLLGSRLRSVSNFPSVPAGTDGKVVKAIKSGTEEWRVRVKWSLPRKRSAYWAILGDLSLNFGRCEKPVVDDFSKDDFESLVEVLDVAPDPSAKETG